MPCKPPKSPWPRLLLAVLCAALFGPACDAVTSKRTTEQNIPVQPGVAVHLSTRNGWIQVRPGRSGFVSLRAHGRVVSLRKGEQGLDQLDTQVSKEPGILKIRAYHPRDPAGRRYQHSLVVTVPRQTSLTLTADRGTLDVADLSGDVRGRTREGEIRIQDVTGALDLSTGAGNIQATGQFPRFRLETRLGEVRVVLSPGTPLSADSSALSRRGAVSLTLPPGLPTTVVAEARKGQVVSDAPAQSKRPGWLRALLSGGGPQITLVSFHGPVRVRMQP